MGSIGLGTGNDQKQRFATIHLTNFLLCSLHLWTTRCYDKLCSASQHFIKVSQIIENIVKSWLRCMWFGQFCDCTFKSFQSWDSHGEGTRKLWFQRCSSIVILPAHREKVLGPNTCMFCGLLTPHDSWYYSNSNTLLKLREDYLICQLWVAKTHHIHTETLSTTFF